MREMLTGLTTTGIITCIVVDHVALHAGLRHEALQQDLDLGRARLHLLQVNREDGCAVPLKTLVQGSPRAAAAASSPSSCRPYEGSDGRVV